MCDGVAVSSVIATPSPSSTQHRHDTGRGPEPVNTMTSTLLSRLGGLFLTLVLASIAIFSAVLADRRPDCGSCGRRKADARAHRPDPRRVPPRRAGVDAVLAVAHERSPGGLRAVVRLQDGCHEPRRSALRHHAPARSLHARDHPRSSGSAPASSPPREARSSTAPSRSSPRSGWLCRLSSSRSC